MVKEIKFIIALIVAKPVETSDVRKDVKDTVRFLAASFSWDAPGHVERGKNSL